MKRNHVRYAAFVAVLLGAGSGAFPASAASRTLTVHPGESIQKAVDAARSGDTVLVQAGTYHESVTVKTSGLTLRGVGPRTVIVPPEKKAAPGSRAAVGCVEGGKGICVVGLRDKPVEDVTVSDLKLTGFSGVGLWSLATDRLTVQRVSAEKNGKWGISQEHSTRGVFRNNVARDNGDAGLYLANTTMSETGATDSRGLVVEGNDLEGNRNGLTVLRLRNLTVQRNHLVGNCTGMIVIGDENKPRAGALTVRENHVLRNNKYCAKTARLPFVQGAGIVLSGAESVSLTHNVIAGNSGASTFSGGVVLFKSMVGAGNEKNRVDANWFAGNAPADLVNQNASKDGNLFRGNFCQVSIPAGLC
ncbi:right-handed parallel beta-helix repeat-containing protein [Streptomyces sp. NBC_00820]|uniref:right-handed parallel beta-helix repeat-containing protein n=1 Tax=Streptomyces sp. NBC_00820 TaxID=2975842 RepID=UPI002ED00D99|nr:right-handed parallel beta-helix repeat-containing protein [Streptomyces sp. NBC_00820]